LLLFGQTKSKEKRFLKLVLHTFCLDTHLRRRARLWRGTGSQNFYVSLRRVFLISLFYAAVKTKFDINQVDERSPIIDTRRWPALKSTGADPSKKLPDRRSGFKEFWYMAFIPSFHCISVCPGSDN